MVDLITVHGTFAANKADEGEKWWQKGSPFLIELQNLLVEPINILPFHWTGKNSELDRRKAGNALFKKIARLKTQPIVIGHSHGGSVGAHALVNLLIRKEKNAPKGLLTIGMPFIIFRRNANPFTRFNLLGRILFLAGVAVVLSSIFGEYYNRPVPLIAVSWKDFAASSGLNEVFSNAVLTTILFLNNWFGGSVSELATAFVIFILLFQYTKRSRKRAEVIAKNRIKEELKDVHKPFIHSQDEAYNALKSSLALKPSIVRFLTVFLSSFSIILFLSFFLDLSSKMTQDITNEAHYLTDKIARFSAIKSSRVRNDNSYFVEGIFAADFPDYYIYLSPSVFDRNSDNVRQRLFDRFFAQQLYLRHHVSVVPMRIVWESDAVRAITDKPEAEWILKFQKTYGEDGALVFMLQGREQEFIDSFAKVVAQLDAIGETGYAPDSDLISGNLLGQPISYTLTDLFVRAMQKEFWIDRTLDYDKVHKEWRASDEPKSIIRDGVEIVLAPPKIAAAREAAKAAIAQLEFHSAMVAPSLAMTPQAGDRMSLLRDTPFIEGQKFATGYDWVCQNGEDIYDVAICNFFYKTFEFRPVLLLYGFADLKQRAVKAMGNRFAFGSSTSDGYDGVNLLAIIAFYVAISGAIGAVVSFIVTPLLQRFMINTLKNNAYGNDGFGERVVDVRASLDFFNDDAKGLPNSVESEMLNNSLEDAPAAIQRMRSLLADGGLGAVSGSDPLSIAMKFDKSELIHNAYFHSPLFIKYLAALMIAHFDLTPSETFDEDTDACEFLDALKV